LKNKGREIEMGLGVFSPITISPNAFFPTGHFKFSAWIKLGKGRRYQASIKDRIIVG
jgi:hypothetical protein